jgi:ribosomal protein L34E
MRKIETKYYCDYCGKVLGKKPHISICMGPYAGLVKPSEWKHKKKIETRPYQFCDIDNCLAEFLIKNCTKKQSSKTADKKK